MIDIHCHILPGMDDGPATIDESIEMCRMAASDGIHTIVATPHFSHGAHEWTAESIFGQIGRLEQALLREKIGVRILPGADVSLFPELVHYLGKEIPLTINNKRRHILAEFPCAVVPPHWDLFLRSVLDAGIVPIVTHPERNDWFVRHPEAMYTMVEIGAMVQITAMSITGGFGEEARKFSSFLLTHDLAHVIATDAHSIGARPPVLSEAVKAAANLVGEERARDLVTSIPSAIIEGRPVQLPEPRERNANKGAWLRKAFRFMAHN